MHFCLYLSFYQQKLISSSQALVSFLLSVPAKKTSNLQMSLVWRFLKHLKILMNLKCFSCILWKFLEKKYFPILNMHICHWASCLVKTFYQVFSSHADGMVSCDMPCDGRGCFGLQSSLIIACASYFWMDDLVANLSPPLTRPRKTLQSLIFLMGHPGCLWIKLPSEWNRCLGLSVFLTVPLSQKKKVLFGQDISFFSVELIQVSFL